MVSQSLPLLPCPDAKTIPFKVFVVSDTAQQHQRFRGSAAPTNSPLRPNFFTAQKTMPPVASGNAATASDTASQRQRFRGSAAPTKSALWPNLCTVQKTMWNRCR